MKTLLSTSNGSKQKQQATKARAVCLGKHQGHLTKRGFSHPILTASVQNTEFTNRFRIVAILFNSFLSYNVHIINQHN